MKLDLQQKLGTQSGYSWSSESNRSQTELVPNMWVQLLELPSNWSFDEALLLCQNSENEWVAWIPNHGEAMLQTSQFCL